MPFCHFAKFFSKMPKAKKKAWNVFKTSNAVKIQNLRNVERFITDTLHNVCYVK